MPVQIRHKRSVYVCICMLKLPHCSVTFTMCTFYFTAELCLVIQARNKWAGTLVHSKVFRQTGVRPQLLFQLYVPLRSELFVSEKKRVAPRQKGRLIRLVYTYDARTSISHVWTGTTQAQEKGVLVLASSRSWWCWCSRDGVGGRDGVGVDVVVVLM